MVGVVGLGQTRAVGAVKIELLAVEIRHLGAALHWRIASNEDVLTRPPWLAVSDPSDTTYDVISQLWSSSGTEMRIETRFSPRPPLAASELTFEVGPPAPGLPATQYRVAIGWNTAEET